MKTVAVIQARMGSTRLPGKVMLPLASDHVLTHVVQRVGAADRVDEVVVATTETTGDDIVARYADRAGARVFRGSEPDVLDRVYGAAGRADADVVARITADCPLISPEVIDAVVEARERTGADYCANVLERTFPRGLDVEAFTFDSLEAVHEVATDPHYREHVTPYYREAEDRFAVHNVPSTAVFEQPALQNRSDLRLTLDTADDYELLRTVYDRVTFDSLLSVGEVVEFVDENDLEHLNAAVEQKDPTDASGDQG